jgi:hypothetical protein
MKALSIRQPWAWAILHAGKDIENRDWKDYSRDIKFRGPFLIHASGGMTRGEYQEFVYLCDQQIKLPDGVVGPAFDMLPRGGFVGRARVVDVVRESASPWFFGPRGLVLIDAQPGPFTPFKGMLGFFDVPDDIARLYA